MAFSSIAKPVISLDSLDDGQQNYVAYILIWTAVFYLRVVPSAFICNCLKNLQKSFSCRLLRMATKIFLKSFIF
jgi:hypothetical protein